MTFHKCLIKMSIVLSTALPMTAQKQFMMVQRPVAVPDFTGKTLQQVKAEAVVPGSQIPLFLGIYPRGLADGVVASQTPGAHTPVIPGSTRLLLTLDAPKPTALQTILQQLAIRKKAMTQVPSLETDSREVAARSLEAAHLVANFTGDKAGVVVQQYPPAGNSVEAGSTVTVTLAPPDVDVPLLFGMTLAAATRSLTDNSLQLKGTYGDNTDGSTVTSQSVPAGTHVPPGTSLEITLSAPPVISGPKPPPPAVQQVVVPNLAKMNSKLAGAVLRKVGLRIGSVSGPSAGHVTDQAPTAGTMVESGTPVAFTLASVVPVVPVPPRPPWVLIGIVVAIVIIAPLVWLLSRSPGPILPATCTVAGTRVIPNIQVGNKGGPSVRFRLHLRDGKSVEQCVVKDQPAIRKVR
jgi:beta-lactam-binding protein with PASTA domain